MKDLLTFIGDEQRRSNVTIQARIQPFCENHNTNIGCYDRFRVSPRSMTEEI